MLAAKNLYIFWGVCETKKLLQFFSSKCTKWDFKIVPEYIKHPSLAKDFFLTIPAIQTKFRFHFIEIDIIFSCTLLPESLLMVIETYFKTSSSSLGNVVMSLIVVLLEDVDDFEFLYQFNSF